LPLAPPLALVPLPPAQVQVQRSLLPVPPQRVPPQRVPHCPSRRTNLERPCARGMRLAS